MKVIYLLLGIQNKKKYVEIENLEDAVKLDTLNESHEQEESKYNEYCEILLKQCDLDHLKNLIEKYK